MSYRCLLFIAVFLTAELSHAQQDKIVIHFTDATNNASLKNVAVYDNKGLQIAWVDSQGYAVLQLTLFKPQSYLVVICPGYKPDTLFAPVTAVHMEPLAVALKETIISSSKIHKLLQEPNEFVVDYDFTGDDLLVATYSGNNGGHAKLFLLGNNGNIMATSKLAAEPLALYRSCIGIHYCVCYDKFYPLRLGSDNIAVDKPYRIALLQGLKQCEQSINGNLYYKLADRTNFRIQYGMIKKGDSIFRPINTFEEKDVAAASKEEWIEILELLEHPDLTNLNEAARKQSLRLMWDNGSYVHINMPLLTENDTLIIFDFFKKQLLLYALSGELINRVPIHFNWKESQKFSVLKDEASNKIYIHRYNNPAAQTIEELDINTGTTLPGKTTIERPFAEDVKIYRGAIYFLWEDKSVNATRQLYIQKND